MPLFILQVYLPPNAKLNLLMLSTSLCYENMIVIGDLKCKICKWNWPTMNTNGKVLLKYYIETNVEISVRS